jgi:hypothetical protein
MSAEATALPEMGPAAPGDAARVADTLLKDPAALLGQQSASTARTLLGIVAAGAAAFGGAVGLYRGGWQTLFAAIKLPLVVLLTTMVSTAALVGLSAALGRVTEPRRQLMLVLVAVGRGCLVLAATAPLLLVAVCIQLDYHRTVLLMVACCAVAGWTGLGPLARLLWAERQARLTLVAALLVVVGVAGTHLSWVFRPYLVRPRETAVPFLRALDGGFTGAVIGSMDSARGVYHRPEAPVRLEPGR